MLTLAGFLVATAALISSITKDNRQAEREAATTSRETLLREQASWEVEVTHLPKTRSLRVVLFCNKTSDTIEPKNVAVSIGIEYLNALRDFVGPLQHEYHVPILTPVTSRQLKWECPNIAEHFDAYRDHTGKIADTSVLGGPIGLNIEVTYNSDLHAATRAQLFPRSITEAYLEKGMCERFTFDHIRTPARGG